MSSPPVVTLRVMTQKMPVPTVTSYGTTLTFDFGLDSGQYILASSVALSGFQMMYATQSNDSHKQVQQCGIKLMPTLVGSKVVVTVSLVLTDYSGDGAAEPQDVSDRETYAYVTVLAITGTSAATSYALCNAFGVGASGSGNIPVPVSPGVQTAFLSGFDFAYEPGDSKDVLGLVASCGWRSGTAPNTDQVTGSATMDPLAEHTSTSSVDLGFLAVATPGGGQVQAFALVRASFDWSDEVNDNGISGTVSASFSGQVPSGYQLTSAALLLTNITMEYGDENYHELGTLAAGLTGSLTVNTSGASVSGPVVMNVFADESPDREISAGDSELEGYILGVFTPVSA